MSPEMREVARRYLDETEWCDECGGHGPITKDCRYDNCPRPSAVAWLDGLVATILAENECLKQELKDANHQ